MVDKELKEQILRLRFEEGRTVKSLAEEYGISRNTLENWCTKFRKAAESDKEKAKVLATMEENLKLKRENEELKKEVDFLKKAAAFFAKDLK